MDTDDVSIPAPELIIAPISDARSLISSASSFSVPSSSIDMTMEDVPGAEY